MGFWKREHGERPSQADHLERRQGPRLLRAQRAGVQAAGQDAGPNQKGGPKTQGGAGVEGVGGYVRGLGEVFSI